MAVTNYYTVDGSLIAEETGAARLDYHLDALGSITAQTDSTQTVVAAGRYAAYGLTYWSNAAQENTKYSWCGSWGYRKTHTSVSGYPYAEQYVRARHYSTATARWTTADVLMPAEPTYAYCRQQSTSAIDFCGSQGQWIDPNTGKLFTPFPGTDPRVYNPTTAPRLFPSPSPSRTCSPKRSTSPKPPRRVRRDYAGRPKLPGGDSYVANCCEAMHHSPLDQLWFADMVGRGCPWDYKRLNPNDRDLWYVGNFHYGFVAACMGIPLYEARSAAGVAQVKDHGFVDPGVPFLIWPYADDPESQREIEEGYNDALRWWNELQRKCSCSIETSYEKYNANRDREIDEMVRSEGELTAPGWWDR